MNYTQLVEAGINPAMASALCVKARPDAYTLGERELMRMLECVRDTEVANRGLDLDAPNDQEYIAHMKTVRATVPYGERYVDVMPCLTLHERVRASETATWKEQRALFASEVSE